jgi:hypothetical protein
VIRSTLLVVASVLLVVSMPLHAQRGSRHSGSGGGSGKPSTNPSSSGDSEIRGFEREFALQATPDQVSQFQVLSKHTESALKQARDFVHLIETGSKPPEFSDPADDLQDSVQDAHDGSKEFVAKFSSQQKSAYKALTKKLAKANSDLDKQDQAFKQGTKGPNVDNQNLLPVLKKLEQALSALQAEQTDLAKAMGIQVP